ncbi:MAG: thiamine pyrophosphate-binding protein [Ilumatobacteraceae bacterium]
MGMLDGHAGEQTVAALAGFGVETMFTLNGGHIWPFYEAARNQSMRVVDTRHEQTATFAAEAMAKLTRRPGLAALTAGPGITNGVSAITSAHFNGSPLVVLGGRAPSGRWGAGSLQELDHVPIVASVTKSALTVTDPAAAGTMVHDAATLAMTPRRGPVFLDFPLDVFGPSAGEVPDVAAGERGPDPDLDAVGELAAALASAERPAFIVGSDVYWARSEAALVALVEQFDIPCLFNGMGRGTIAADHRLAFLRTRGVVKERADLVVVLGTPLDFRLGFGRWGDARAVHVVEDPSSRAAHVDVLTVTGRLADTLAMLADGVGPKDPAGRTAWVAELRTAESAAAERDEQLLDADADPIRPSRIYGELRRRLARDAVVICDGGDFASYAGKFVEVYEPGCWLDTGPYGCLGNGLGYAIAARVARPVLAGRCAARRRRRRLQPHGCRHARTSRVAGRHGGRQQRDLGAGEAPDAGHLRLGRRLRPAAADPLRRGRALARRGRGDGERTGRARCGARPCLRCRLPVPRQRAHRSRRHLPAHVQPRLSARRRSRFSGRGSRRRPPATPR